MNIDHVNEWIGLAMNSGVLVLVAVLIGLAITQIKRLMHQPMVLTNSGNVLDKVYEDLRHELKQARADRDKAYEQLAHYTQYEEMIEHATRTANLGG